jgi:hypothetical protein
MKALPALLVAALAVAPAYAQNTEETPAGRVPPPPASRTSAGDLPGETGVMAQPEAAAEVDVDKVVRDFAAAYAAQQSPRVMVFFNRELSAEVQEWVASERIAIEGQSREVKGGERTDRSGGVAISRQYANSDGGRVGPGERWMWEFEQAIADLLLDARVNLIDRAVVMRRQAASGDEMLGNAQTSARTLEMQALDQYADVLMELWVVRSSESPVGYEFRAQVKDLKTGRLITTVTTFGDGVDEPRRVYAASSTGYQAYEELPTVEDAAQALGVELMESLVKRWR